MVTWEYSVVYILNGVVWMIDDIEVGGKINRAQSEVIDRLNAAGQLESISKLFQSDKFMQLGEDNSPKVAFFGETATYCLSCMGREGWEVVGMSPITMERGEEKQRAVMIVLKRPANDQG